MTVHDVWRDMLSEPSMNVVSREEMDEVIDLLVRHRIDLRTFAGNLIAIASQGRPTLFQDPDEKTPPPSASVRPLLSPMDRPMGMPLWMVAGFPDVVTWHSSRPMAETSDETENASLSGFGIGAAAADSMSQEDFVNSDQKIRARYLANLIENYLKSRQRPLEAAIPPGSNSDMYAAAELLKGTGAEDLFGFIAKMTTMYYSKLKADYPHRFRDETALLGAAGVLDAGVYINVTKQITVQQIMAMAAAAARVSVPLQEFVTGLEIAMMTVDSPGIAREDVENSVRAQGVAIAAVIEATLRSPILDPAISAAADVFMSDRRFKRIRRELGVAR